MLCWVVRLGKAKQSEQPVVKSFEQALLFQHDIAHGELSWLGNDDEEARVKNQWKK